jgi:N-acetylglucosaminyl-diphospho-decaprenol L-rhamnosyltransferase
MNLAVVVVNYKSASLVDDLVRSIDRIGWPDGMTMIIVDNDSGDGSFERLTLMANSRSQGQIRVLAAGNNRGFGAGNNLGIQTALEERSSLIWLLNPDTLVQPGAIDAMVRFFDERPTAGILGARLVDAHGRVDASAHVDHSPFRELEIAARTCFRGRRRAERPTTSDSPEKSAARAPMSCDWVSGASMMVRREVFENAGIFDERFFLYYEEVDLCRRARSAGWEIWHLPAAEIVHLEGVTTGIASRSRRRARYWFDSRRYYFVKHYGLWGLFLADAFWLLGRGIRAAKAVLGRTIDRDPPLFAWDLLMGDLLAVTRHTPSSGRITGTPHEQTAPERSPRLAPGAQR